jgi:hypothetical protein
VNEERRAELEQLLSQSDSLIADYFRDTPEPADEVEDLLEDSRLDAAARLDPRLGGLRNSQYIVRIRRDDQLDSLIDGPSVRDVMYGIEAEVFAAAPSAHDEARLELDSVTRGSVVLHYRAVKPLRTVDEGQFDHGLSVVDAAISHVTELHRAIEDGLPAAQIRRIANSSELLEASRGLITHLTTHGLNLATRWRGAQGERVVGRLSERAKDHAVTLFEKKPADDDLPISGMVISMSLDGSFVLSTGRRRYEVGSSPLGVDLMRSGEIRLGERRSFILKQEIATDRVGLKSKAKYGLVGIDQRLVP